MIKLLHNMSEVPVQPLDYYHSFAKTRFGARANTMPRWERFMPYDLDVVSWQERMGADVNNLEHGRLQYGMTRWYIRKSRDFGVDVSDEDDRALLITAINHDHAEALDGHDDMPSGTKTDLDKLHELTSAFTASVDGRFYPDLSPEAQQEAANLVMLVQAPKKPGEDDRLHQLFYASEMLNHLRTSFIALSRLDEWRVGGDQGDFDDSSDDVLCLEALIAESMVYLHPRLRELAKTDPVVADILISQQPVLDRCYKVGSGYRHGRWATIFPNHIQQDKLLAFERASLENDLYRDADVFTS